MSEEVRDGDDSDDSGVWQPPFSEVEDERLQASRRGYGAIMRLRIVKI